MPRRPLELQSLKWPFMGLAVLLDFSSLWAVYDEAVPRRPWKNFHREFRHENQAAEEARLQREFDGWQRKIDEKTRLYNEAIAAQKAATQKRLAFIQRRDSAQAKIEATEKPIREIDKRLQAFSGLGK